ncbi:IS110 family transposase [Pseudotabrizicola sediminis]|uniref:IS110 family transposase n=1 Tax=Pseudotabrizicola sediminis TaxID=2486418 RepID=A0ABY2KK16_9RHOB|nr:IS110 family transposase [Pseudotabrizicola sediminis]TGD41435.1 IS110 family transposase [Pseudotabrizicola sediminis]
MNEVSIIGLDLAKNVFQAHGAEADGSVLIRRKLSRAQLLKFLSEQPPCIVAMEACASAHHWGRAIGCLGHEVRLIPPAYVKPFVKRQKNDTADAEAIAEAASRPTMRFVAVKSEEQQAAMMAYRTRDLLVRQRTQTINALRAHLAEQGFVAPVGPAHVGRLAAVINGDDGALPAAVRDLARLLLDQIAGLSEKVADLDAELRRRASTTVRRLTTIPGIGPITAAAITTFAPPMEIFEKGRDFAARVGLTPRQHSSGGKERLGRTSKMGQRDIRRLLIVGAVAVVRWAARKGAPEGSWLARMLDRKPKMLVAVALANRMARTAWALMRRGEDYRDPAMATA